MRSESLRGTEHKRIAMVSFPAPPVPAPGHPEVFAVLKDLGFVVDVQEGIEITGRVKMLWAEVWTDPKVVMRLPYSVLGDINDPRYMAKVEKQIEAIVRREACGRWVNAVLRGLVRGLMEAGAAEHASP